MESIWVAAEMRAGGAYAHSILAIEDMERVDRLSGWFRCTYPAEPSPPAWIGVVTLDGLSFRTTKAAPN